MGIAAEVARVLAQRLHRFLISSPDLGIDARISPKTTFYGHRFLISGPDLGIDAAPSLLQLRMARLQRSRGVQAGTGCHEGGIILRKSRRSGVCPRPSPQPIPTTPSTAGPVQTVKTKKLLPNCFGTVKNDIFVRLTK